MLLPSKETLTLLTPLSLDTVLLTLASQAEHVIPLTSNLLFINTP